MLQTLGHGFLVAVDDVSSALGEIHDRGPVHLQARLGAEMNAQPGFRRKRRRVHQSDASVPEGIRERHHDFSVIDEPPPRGKDVNEFLQFRVGLLHRKEMYQR